MENIIIGIDLGWGNIRSLGLDLLIWRYILYS